MRLAKPILDEEGRVLLGTGVELGETLLSRLKDHQVPFLYIMDERTEDVDIPDMLSPEVRQEATRLIRTHFRRLMSESVKTRMFSRYELGSDMRKLMDLLISDLSQTGNAMIMLGDMQLTEHYLYQHSLDVCIYTTLLGMKSGYNRDELHTLGLGALLHDIGKTKIPLSLLKKPGKLTEDEFAEVKRHTLIGFDILRQEPNIPLLSAHCALQHHERLDGSGYPRQLASGEIHDYARFVGMVDVYDALTRERPYRAAMLPHQAIEILYMGADKLFDLDKLILFRDKIAIYPIGMEVKLSSGESGVVVDLNANVPHRPVVRILSDADGLPLSAPYEVDLSNRLFLTIVEVCGTPATLSGMNAEKSPFVSFQDQMG
ncbi:HD-GYP domain-containing protein [Gorillibacterium massiliense]|uniref:HD-GYP domain-containing protein n=1 Tax=Gorillibacterium massiliense TaxID=1280390 RepID=UPI0004B4001B|nr:HD-GYP domain-containing protein [Gorillibacterium massiliense]